MSHISAPLDVALPGSLDIPATAAANGIPEVVGDNEHRGLSQQTCALVSWMITVAFWLTIVIGGSWTILAYTNAPGESGEVPHQWPAASKVARPPGQKILLMFLHPRCPCSRASVGELELLMAATRGTVVARVVFLRPEGFGEEWVKTDLWAKANAIPGVTVELDDAGLEGRRFGVQTSGDTLLYDEEGNLQFHGGITLGRGHAGDNPGREALVSLLRGTPARAATPVFGCTLFTRKGGQRCR